ncbi:MAG: flavodoxin family protein [Clostridiaceae bacterium]
MRLLIHDLSEEQFNFLFPDEIKGMHIVSDDGTIGRCIGCFGCWMKTPGVCIIKDKYENMGELLSKSDEVIIVSKCLYGGFSPFVKNVMDRSISYVLPYFETRNGEMHHKPRYDHHIAMKVWFYGEDITDQEKKTANELIKANSINLSCNYAGVNFIKELSEITLS